MNFNRHLFPKRLTKAIRYIIYRVLDFKDTIMGSSEPMVPKRIVSLIIGGGDFKEIGKSFVGHFVKYGGLQKDDSVLEIGSGYGRMAVGLTSFLSSSGTYDGLEIMPEAVTWCSKEITSRYSNFRFHHADVKNEYSNSEGTLYAEKYKFPFKDECFNFVFLTSVFTHMKSDHIDSYLSEIDRVVKPNAKIFITYYLIDDFTTYRINEKKANLLFQHKFDNYYSTSKDNPEETIAYDIDYIKKLYLKYNFNIEEPIHYGSWSGRDQFLTYQDVIIASKNP